MAKAFWGSTPTSTSTSPSSWTDSAGTHGSLQFAGDRCRCRASCWPGAVEHGARAHRRRRGHGQLRLPAAPAALQAAGITVFEVNRPDRANRRRKGKSDPIDAEAAARAVLAGQATAVPKNREGAVEALRALTIARNSAVKATTTASNQVKALLVGTDQDLRDQLRVKSLLQLATRGSQLAPTSGMHAALASLGRRWLQLHEKSSSSTG